MAHPSAPGSELVLAGFLGVLGRAALAFAVADLAAASAEVERPDEWRIDLDPMPRCEFATVRRAARIVHEILYELGMAGWPKTSGGNGLHIYVRIELRCGFADLRRPRMPSPGKSNAARRVRW
jgi:DNA primase